MLYNRIINQGTINEPKGKAHPEFALPSTVNWMHALRLLIDNANLNFQTASTFYSQLQARNMGILVENTVLEQLLLSLHHLSALEQFRLGTVNSDYARVGILTWYYGIANAASAMTAAQDGSFKEDHAGTARLWDNQIANAGFAMEPFSWRVSSLVEKTYKEEIMGCRGGSTHNLRTKPNSKIEALGAAAGYLSGSAKWYAWNSTENIRKKKEFKALGVENFRTKDAQRLRDSSLSTKSIGFVHQASRYRGKANYREALFLVYGTGTEAILSGFSDDLARVLRGFLVMAGAFAQKKLGDELWTQFVTDVDAKCAFTLKASSIWK